MKKCPGLDKSGGSSKGATLQRPLSYTTKNITKEEATTKSQVTIERYYKIIIQSSDTKKICPMALITTTSLRFNSATETHAPAQPPSLPVTPPPPPVSTAQTPPPSTLAEIQENQLNNIIDALIGAGDFAGWANLLSSTDPSALPLTATLFIPSNDAISHLSSAKAAGITFDPFLIPYHIVPQRLTFSDLQQFTTHTRLPTLLPYKYIVITNNSPSNFTVDDSQITQADIFVNAAFTVHGIKKILDYSVYGGNSLLSPPPENTKSPRPKLTPGPPKKREPVFPGEITVGLRSGASCSCSWILMIFSTSCAVSVFKIV
ncbi:hypothetical protein Pfo_012546 [Paulownia fortunei]|nr:hypothetical protein Pfo_012546 [Paulownia fortunei]